MKMLKYLQFYITPIHDLKNVLMDMRMQNIRYF